MVCLCNAFFAKGESGDDDDDDYYHYDNGDDNIASTMKHMYICNQ